MLRALRVLGTFLVLGLALAGTAAAATGAPASPERMTEAQKLARQRVDAFAIKHETIWIGARNHFRESREHAERVRRARRGDRAAIRGLRVRRSGDDEGPIATESRPSGPGVVLPDVAKPAGPAGALAVPTNVRCNNPAGDAASSAQSEESVAVHRRQRRRGVERRPGIRLRRRRPGLRLVERRRRHLDRRRLAAASGRLSGVSLDQRPGDDGEREDGRVLVLRAREHRRGQQRDRRGARPLHGGRVRVRQRLRRAPRAQPHAVPRQAVDRVRLAHGQPLRDQHHVRRRWTRSTSTAPPMAAARGRRR